MKLEGEKGGERERERERERDVGWRGLEDLPGLQVFPSFLSVYPGRQEHSAGPSELHVCWQPPFLIRHRSTVEVNKITNVSKESIMTTRYCNA